MTDSRIWALLAVLLAGPAHAADPAVVITPSSAARNVFGDREGEFQFRVTATRAVEGRVVWRLAVGTATIKAGERELKAAPNAAFGISLKLPIPPVKDGVVLHTRLTVAVVEANATEPAATLEHDIWVFPKNPFADRAAWLKSLRVTLYDPVGPTAKLFAAASIPFEQARDVDVLSGVKRGVVIVGEGVSFKEERGLAAVLDRLAGAGVGVLCLAPLDGEVLIPGLGGPAGELRELTFRRDVSRRFDKRLDPASLPVAASVLVKTGDDGVRGEVTPGAAGWPWVEANYGAGKGRFAVCGLAVVAKWEAGPTPRFLFSRVLEHLTESEQP